MGSKSKFSHSSFLMRVGFLQNNPKILKVRENLDAALSLIRGKEADLWVFPEFFATGYTFKSKKEVAQVAEKVPGGLTTGVLLEFTRKRGCAVVAGLVESSGTRFYNSCVLVHRGKVSVYRKTHLFGNEKKFFTPGDSGFKVQDVSGTKVGMMICFDWFFPEAARTLALKGAEIIAHPSNLVLPWGPEAMKIRSLENRVFTVTANRTGAERGLRFIGQSQVVSSKGQVLKRAGREEAAASVLIEPALARDKKVTPLNDLFRDRRPRRYSVG